MAVSWGMNKAATGLSCGGFTPPLLKTTRGAAVQSTENTTETRSQLEAALERLADQSKPNTWRNGVAAVRDTDVRLVLAALAAERDRADRATELVRLLSDQDQCWSDGGEDCAAHGLPWVTTRKCANGAALDFLDGTEATT